MGLNVKDIKIRLCRVFQVSTETSHKFIQRHPLVSGALLVCFILYIFLSYIYSFLAYLSPFLLCAAIFVRIFWSSEKTQLRYVKTEEEKEEQKRAEPTNPKMPNYGRREVLFKYPSHNAATSRRRNFRERKWDVYGGLEEKAKNLSAVFRNEFPERNTEKREAKYYAKGKSSLGYGWSAERFQAPTRQILISEPSKRGLVEDYGDGKGRGTEKETERMEDGDDYDDEEEEEETQEDRNKAAVQWTENDQKNLMDLGISEIERNKRLESLIARRRARKLLKLQIEKGLVDLKSVPPSQIAPLFITRGNPLDSPRDFDGIEMPGSAPSVMPGSPYDIPYDPSEERPNLTGDSFQQEFTCHHQKDMPFSRHDSFTLGPFSPLEPKHDLESREPDPFFNTGRKVSDRLAYPRFRRLSDKGNHDWLIEKLFSKECGESGFKAPNTVRKGEETKHEEDGKCTIETDMAHMKDEEEENAHATKFISDHTSPPDLTPNISNVETTVASEKLGPRVISTTITTATTANESMCESIPSPVYKNQENMFFTGRRIRHTPTHSIASDLQVELSEVGSPTRTVDESLETNTSSDGESVVYDGDIDKDGSSASEDLWGASFHGREVHGVSEEDTADSKDIASLIPVGKKDKENVTDMHEGTPTHAINSDHNIFGNRRDSVGETEAPQSSNSLHVSSPQKQLMDDPVDHLPHETHLEKPEELCNQSENLINEAQVINDVNNSAVTEQDNTENSKRNEEPGTSVVRQESIDEVSVNSISSSPRSVLPETTIADQVSPSAYNEQMHIGVQQSNMDDMEQTTLNGESPPDTMPQNVQPLMDDPTVETHNSNFNQSQEQTNHPENSIEESNIFAKMKDEGVYNKEGEGNLNVYENSQDKSTSSLIRQEVTAESSRLAEETATDEVDEKPRELMDDKVPSNSLMIESSSEVHGENEDNSQTSTEQETTAEQFISAEADAKNHLQSESKELVEDRGNISKDLLKPKVTEVSDSKAAEDNVEKSNMVNNNEAAEQEFNKEETTVSTESVGESSGDQNTEAHTKEPGEVVHQLEDANEPKPDKPSDSSEAGYFQGESAKLIEDYMKDKPSSSNAQEDLPQPRVTEPNDSQQRSK